MVLFLLGAFRFRHEISVSEGLKHPRARAEFLFPVVFSWTGSLGSFGSGKNPKNYTPVEVDGEFGLQIFRILCREVERRLKGDKKIKERVKRRTKAFLCFCVFPSGIDVLTV
ncbi:hypothetical protein RUM43_002590 [Polyplax serrata]|uniref:Uncharacterized protein n=1 Tax=Polyplax serrata TaxID=468196 RepID=A0AAN8NZ13_POLSC